MPSVIPKTSSSVSILHREHQTPPFFATKLAKWAARLLLVLDWLSRIDTGR
jgi:hypothetical protein